MHQLWKWKFPKEDLSNHRFIHIKDWLPKCVEAVVVNRMKQSILESGTKYQIGGKPYHRVEEHLITLKALINRSIDTVGGCIIQLVDIKGFFDAENLRGVMGSLYTAKVQNKMYRLWFKLNSKTVISVVTPSGETESGEAGDLCGQGSAGAALASQLDIDLGVSCYFQDSKDESSYGSVRVGNIKLNRMLSERL